MKMTGVRGLTLVELLVVVAILAVLAALLMPALQGARERSKNAHCVNNSRQTGVGLNAYLMDNNQLFPYSNPANTFNSWPAASLRLWNKQIAAYVGGLTSTSAAELFYCPANPWPVPRNLTLAQNPPTLYGLNSGLFPGNWHDASGVNPTNGPGHYVRRLSLSEIPRPGAVMFTGERPYALPGTAPWNMYDNQGDAANLPFVLPNYASYWVRPDVAIRCSGCNPKVRVNHNLGWNALMGDGRVERVTKEYMISIAHAVHNGWTSDTRIWLWTGGKERSTYVGDDYLNAPKW
ncbi:MAG: hypothetical protein PCFJNLEI_03631 [Verrucomicrobiae bacterium]|nr:hypothetical protein [Verrucomicrobiae bacterium]